MTRGSRNWIVAAAFLALAACATPYQRWGNRGGYLETRLREDEYEVSFAANLATNRATIYDYALLRAAEIGARLGFTHFAVLGATDATVTTVTGVNTTTTVKSEVGEDGEYTSTTETNSSPAVAVAPRLVLRVRYFDGMPHERHLEVYEVAPTLAELAGRHDVKLPPAAR